MSDNQLKEWFEHTWKLIGEIGDAVMDEDGDSEICSLCIDLARVESKLDLLLEKQCALTLPPSSTKPKCS